MRLAGVELGGTKVVAAVATEDQLRSGTHEAELRVATTTPTATLGAVRAFLAHHAVDAVGVASFGPADVDPRSATWGRIQATPKPGWSGVDVAHTLGGGLPVGFATDVEAAALAESREGAGRHARGVLYLTFGTGIGGSLCRDGVFLRGPGHTEMGHQRIPGDGFGGVCPFHGGCWEGLASGPAVAARAGRSPEDLDDDDPVWEPVIAAWGTGIANLLLVVMPDVVVVGGGLMRAAFLGRLRQGVGHALAGYHSEAIGDVGTRVVQGALGAVAGVRGALFLASEVATRRSGAR